MFSFSPYKEQKPRLPDDFKEKHEWMESSSWKLNV